MKYTHPATKWEVVTSVEMWSTVIIRNRNLYQNYLIEPVKSLESPKAGSWNFFSIDYAIRSWLDTVESWLQPRIFCSSTTHHFIQGLQLVVTLHLFYLYVWCDRFDILFKCLWFLQHC